MHFVKVKSILSKNNGMNIYRGCTHGCIYCDSRSTCYQMNHDFEDIEIKENSVELLELAFMKKVPCMIGTGSMSDPYNHYEKELLYTKRFLELAYRYGFGVTLLTKSNLLLRDIDLIDKINRSTKAVVQVTMTTYDDGLCKKIEPNVCTTSERFEILLECKKRCIPTVVWLCPILPFINDTIENIKGVINYCVKAKVYGIICFGMGVTLRDGDRQYFYKCLDEKFFGIKEKYIKYFKENYEVSSFKNKELMNYFINQCQLNGIEYRLEVIFNFLNSFPKKYKQLSLFD